MFRFRHETQEDSSRYLVFSFYEKNWMKSYIDKNTKYRSRKGASEFEKDFFKVMNNSVFGKTMENIRNRIDVRLVTNEWRAKRLAAKPHDERTTRFDENLVAVHMKKTELVFNKPVYLGMSILDISKTLMYDFHYIYVKKKYCEQCKLLMTDTDSLMYAIETEDFYRDEKDDVLDKFDTSNFPESHPSRIQRMNKKVIGMFKSETIEKGEISEFCGLREKLYSYKMCENEIEEKRCKDVKKNVVSKSIHFEDYKRCLFSGKEELRRMNVIRRRGHELFTEEMNKVALSASDNKRIICEDKIDTLSYGHYLELK